MEEVVNGPKHGSLTNSIAPLKQPALTRVHKEKKLYWVKQYLKSLIQNPLQ